MGKASVTPPPPHPRQSQALCAAVGGAPSVTCKSVYVDEGSEGARLWRQELAGSEWENRRGRADQEAHHRPPAPTVGAQGRDGQAPRSPPTTAVRAGGASGANMKGLEPTRAREASGPGAVPMPP